MRPHTQESFWSRVGVQGDDDCWNWTGCQIRDAYGQIRYQGRKWYTHRLAYTLTHGAIPDGLVVRHRCDNPLCCNPRHLELGSQADNNRDRDERGRHVSLSGEASASSKLSESQVKEIYLSSGSEKDLAAHYGVAPTTIGDIRRRHSWKKVTAGLENA